MTILEKGSESRLETAVVVDGKLMEYRVRSETPETEVGKILLGRVERVLPAMNAAFVDIGRKRNGFLPLRETDSFHALNGKAPLLTGNRVPVQIQRDEKGEKGAFLTRDLFLPGESVLLMPMNRFIGVSKRITDEHERRLLTARGIRIAEERFGLIMRQAALNMRECEIREEAEGLFEEWTELSKGMECRKAPCILRETEADSAIFARDYAARHEIAFLRGEEADLAWREFRVEKQLAEALGRKVKLPGGESLVIDEREALQTIDVNSGSLTEAEEGHSLAYTVNRNVIPEIARQIRLRNLSGMILIDFLDMELPRERDSIFSVMEEALLDDRVKHVLHDFTELGILEMTRKRTSASLNEMMSALGGQANEQKPGMG